MQKLFTLLTENGLRVKLYAADGKLLMLQGHDLSILVTGDDFQLCGQLLLVHNQGMIAGCLEGAGQARKEPLSLMHDGCGFAMHDLRRRLKLRPKGLSEDLMALGNPENGNLAGKMAHTVQGNPGLFGPPGA